MNGSFSQPKSPDSWWFDYFLMVALSKNHWFICQTQQNNSINLRFRVLVGNRLSRTWPGAQMAGSGWSKLSWMKTRVPTLIIVDSSLAINYRLHILKSHSCPGPQITFLSGVIDFWRWKKNLSDWIYPAFSREAAHHGNWWPPSLPGSDQCGAQEARIRIISGSADVMN